MGDVSDADDISSTTVVDTHAGEVRSSQYSLDGRSFACGAANGTVQLWNAVENSCAIVITGETGGAVHSVAFSPNGKILATASWDGSVRLWSVDDGDGSCLVNLFEDHGEVCLSVAFSPDVDKP